MPWETTCVWSEPSESYVNNPKGRCPTTGERRPQEVPFRTAPQQPIDAERIPHEQDHGEAARRFHDTRLFRQNH